MDTKEIPLIYNWTLIIHPLCSAFVDMTNPDKYTIFDWDNDHFATIAVDEYSCTFLNISFGVTHEINVNQRTITLFHEPDLDEE